MLKPLRCDFLTGPLTDGASMDTLKHSLEQQSASIHEMLYYKKNGTGIWMEVTLKATFTFTFHLPTSDRAHTSP